MHRFWECLFFFLKVLSFFEVKTKIRKRIIFHKKLGMRNVMSAEAERSCGRGIFGFMVCNTLLI